MPFPALVFLCLAACMGPSAWGWMGIKSRPQPAPAKTRTTALPAPAKPLSEYPSLSRTVQVIRAGSPGTYGGIEVVRCFNCAPDMVLLNLGDSAPSPGIRSPGLAHRGLERHRKTGEGPGMYDNENRCFYFGYKEKDTAFGGRRENGGKSARRKCPAILT